MITLISGTNRKNSLTHSFSKAYFKLLQNVAPDSIFYDLCGLPPVLLQPKSDFYENKPDEILMIEKKFFIPADKFIFIVPEYNGSYPGIVKLLIDSMDPKVTFKGKKAAIAGIATGRAGNLRGLDHLASVLQHMGCNVMPYMLPVSRAHLEFSNQVYSEPTAKVIQQQIGEFMEY
jgi:chromate reductase, NAD(P)H dehydrogenase (quinone)